MIVECSSHYTPSARPYPDRLPPLEYPGHFVVKKLTTGGIWAIHFNTVLIATFDERDYIVRG